MIDGQDDDDVLILEETEESLDDVGLLEELNSVERGEAEVEVDVDDFAANPGHLTQIADLEKQLADIKEKQLRALADYENLRRRSQKEKSEMRHRVQADLIRELLPMVDNFEAALKAPMGENGEKDFRVGVELIARQLSDVLLKIGVTHAPGEGSVFDPEHHEAVGRVETDEVPKNVVVRELRRGYLLQDKLIRAAMVQVSVPTPEAEAATAAVEAAAEVDDLDSQGQVIEQPDLDTKDGD